MVNVHPDNAGAPPAVTGPFTANSLLLLHRALEWWQVQGFEFVDLPWMVPKEFSDATRPSFCRDIETLHGSFVASGEQSFLHLWNDALTADGAPGYVGWTPCLRDEILDATHQHGFMKLEWFVPLAGENAVFWRRTLEALLVQQRAMFQAIAAQANGLFALKVDKETSGPEQVDLMVGGMEVGSYGRRFFNGRPYLYGTALALPRFTQALERYASLNATLKTSD